MRSSKMATGSGRAAILRRRRNRDRKNRPRSWMTSFPASPSWIQDGDGGNDVWRTSRRPWRRPPDVCPSMSPVEVWLYLDLKSIWALASPRHYPSDWVSCPLATTRKWSVCTCRKLWKTFDFSKLLLYFFWILCFIFFNCTLQQSRIIVQYTVIVGRSLVWLETNLNPTMTILLFSSILSTKRQWQSSTSTRPVWQRQKGVMSRMWSTGYRVWSSTSSVEIVSARKCNIKHHWQSSCSAVSLSCHPIQLR